MNRLAVSLRPLFPTLLSAVAGPAHRAFKARDRRAGAEGFRSYTDFPDRQIRRDASMAAPAAHAVERVAFAAEAIASEAIGEPADFFPDSVPYTEGQAAVQRL